MTGCHNLILRNSWLAHVVALPSPLSIIMHALHVLLRRAHAVSQAALL